MGTPSNISGSSSTALVLSSATIHPPVRSTSLNRNSNHLEADWKIRRIVIIILSGIAFGSIAILLEASWPAVVLLTAVGAALLPTIEYIVYRKYGQNQGSSITSITSRAQPMTRVEALAFLDLKEEIDWKIKKIFLIVLLGIASGSIAILLEFSWPVVGLLTAVGAALLPTIEYIVYRKYGQNQRTSRAPEMSVNEALDLLNIPQENANDIEFINAKYEMLKKVVTPPRNFGQSQMGLGVAELLQKIETAYMLLRAQAGST